MEENKAAIQQHLIIGGVDVGEVVNTGDSGEEEGIGSGDVDEDSRGGGDGTEETNIGVEVHNFFALEGRLLTSSERLRKEA
jgi:hypothetical protein